jgi:hypothetical protein
VRHRLGGVLSVVSAFVVLASCGGGGSTGPSPTPTPTPASISITSTGTVMAQGQVENFSASLVLSNGSTQALTTGTWGTDTPAVATVNPTSGLVTAVGRGEVTIFVDAQGLRGTKRITVTQSYAGFWSGSYLVTACTPSGNIEFNDVCEVLPVASTQPIAFELTHIGTTVAGRTAVGGLISSPFAATPAANGALTFTAVALFEGVTISQAWQMNINQAGGLTGTVVQTWTATGLVGQTVLAGTLVTVTKSPGDSMPGLQSAGMGLSLADVASAARRR